MKSVERAGGGVGDTTRDCECYRCDRDVVSSKLFEITVEPPDVLSSQYQPVVRRCCPDCAASMGMLEFTDRWKGSAHLR
nr:hypothetical protein [Halovivax limisalsi]